MPSISVSKYFTEQIAKGKKLLVPYLTGGLEGSFESLKGASQAGADALELGIPFSDPVLDGPTICEANDLALNAGTTPEKLLKQCTKSDFGIPLVAMTYYNIAYRKGLKDFAQAVKKAGLSGVILADLPIEAAKPWLEAAQSSKIEPILLAAPTATDERLAQIAESSKGFVYAVSLIGVTGERDSLARTTLEITARLKKITDKPVLAGVGISSPDHARKACQVADGVVVGSVLVRKLLETKSPNAVADLVGEFRLALDGK